MIVACQVAPVLDTPNNLLAHDGNCVPEPESDTERGIVTFLCAIIDDNALW